MSGKPDDIPQDVWGAAIAATRYKHIMLDEAIARAIMAERERCANVAEARNELYSRFYANGPLVCSEIASSIRSGEEESQPSASLTG